MFYIVAGAIITGLLLGLLGSGGSTLTVPVLVYLVGHERGISIAESLAIVGAISVVAAIPYARSRLIAWRFVLWFGIPGMCGTYLGALAGGLVSGVVQMAVFGFVLLLAATFMMRSAFGRPNPSKTPKWDSFDEPDEAHGSTWLILLEGLFVGALTGFVGVGGGFMIVPALVFLGGLSMRKSIATSLVIIVLKSAVGFAKYQHDLVLHGQSVDWKTIALFTGVGIAGSLAGRKLNTHLDQRRLRQAFAVFLILIGLFIFISEARKFLG